MLTTYLSSCLFLALCFPYTQQLFAGPTYEVVLKKMENCADAGQKRISVQNMKLKRVKQDVMAVDGKIVISGKQLGNNVEGKIDVWKMNGNQKVSKFFTYDFLKFCDEITKFIPEVFNSECPFAPKEYVLKRDVPLKFSSAVPPAVPFGTYWMKDDLYTSEGEHFGCLELTVDVIKRDGKKKV